MHHYTWIVTRDSVLGDSSDTVGMVGPAGASQREAFDVVITVGERFRMSSRTGQVKFVGYILGEFEGSEPLLDFGFQNGCDTVEYDCGGEWISLVEYLRSRG